MGVEGSSLPTFGGAISPLEISAQSKEPSLNKGAWIIEIRPVNYLNSEILDQDGRGIRRIALEDNPEVALTLDGSVERAERGYSPLFRALASHGKPAIISVEYSNRFESKGEVTYPVEGLKPDDLKLLCQRKYDGLPLPVQELIDTLSERGYRVMEDRGKAREYGNIGPVVAVVSGGKYIEKNAIAVLMPKEPHSEKQSTLYWVSSII